MRPSSTKEIIETGILRFLRRFSRMYKKGERYKADRIGERADPWPTLMFTSKIGDEMLFYR